MEGANNTHVIRRGRGLILIHNSYEYQRNQVRRNAIYWRCCTPTCRSTLRTNAFDLNNPLAITNVQNVNEHDHPANQERIVRQQVVNDMRREIVENPVAPARRVYQNVVANQHRNGVIGNIPRYNAVRAILNRERALQLPPIPNNIADVVINGDWAQTWRHERYLLHCNNELGVVVFATDEDLHSLSQCQTIYIDGTFRSAPNPSMQFVTIHGLIHGHVLKFACALVLNKTVVTYRFILAVIKENILNTFGEQLNPRSVVVDYEMSLIRSLQEEFPGIEIKGCYFHFCKALWRNIQRLGLSQPYNTNPRFKRCIRKITALGFLPIHDVRNCYNHLLRRQTLQLMIAFPNLENFFMYFENTWLNLNATFQLNFWNVFGRPMECRTNNIVESFHRRWNVAVEQRHPSLWHFLRVLKDDHSAHEELLDGVRNGLPPPIRRRKWVQLETRITTLTQEINNGQRNVDDFWRAMRYAIVDFN